MSMWIEKARRDGRKFINPVTTVMTGGMKIMLKVLPEMMFGSRKRAPKRPLGPFATDAAVYATPPASGLRMTWMGHSTTLVEMDGARLLLDPVWEQRAAPMQWSGPKRFFPPTIALRDLPELDAVIFSHDHYDHMGAGTVRELAKLTAQRATKWIVPLEVGAVIAAMGVAREKIIELDWTESVDVGRVKITALPARHFSGRSLFNRNETLWASYVLKGPTHNVYYGGDSGEWPGYAEIGAKYGPFDVTMLEIGAWNEMWSAIHSGPEGAVRNFRALGGAGLLMPIHWGLFDLALHPWLEPIESVWSVSDLKLWAPVPGLPAEVVKGEELRSEWWALAAQAEGVPTVQKQNYEVLE